MGYCPACGIEFDDELEECMRCGGPLIEGTVEEMFDEVDNSEWVELDPLPELPHAVSVKEALDLEGLPCYIKALSSPVGSFYGDQAVILVPETHYDTALEMQQGIAPPDDDDMLLDPDADDEW